VQSRDVYRCLECSELMTNVDEVRAAVTQADSLWQQAVKQLDANQLEGMIHFSAVSHNTPVTV